MKKLQQLIFFGNERLASGIESTDAPTLRALIEAGYEISAVVAHHTAGRSRKARPLEIAEIANAHNIPVLLPHKATEIEEFIKETQPIAGVLVAYGRIIPERIINMFPRGIINIHPSLLPKYRGPTPIEQSILDGASVTGVSLMKLSAAMDAGPVYTQAQYRLVRHETKKELAETLLNIGKEMLIDNLPSILDGTLEPEPQDESRATFSPLLTKDDGAVNPSIQTATEIERTVRAYANYPKTFLFIDNHRIIITKAQTVHEINGADLIIECHNDSLLLIEELTAPSGRTMDGADFKRGYLK